ncbi:unnamed protein product, partial [Polarella glacialis]
VEELLLELTTAAWQRQWQAQQLLRRLDAAEETQALRSRVLALEQALGSAAKAAAQRQGQEEDLRRQLRQSERARLEVTAEHHRQHQEHEGELLGQHDAVGALHRRLEESAALVERMRSELEQQGCKADAQEAELMAAEKQQRRWQSEHQLLERVKELEGTERTLWRQLKEERLTLNAALDQRDRAQAQLRKEAAEADAAHRRAEDSWDQLQRSLQVRPGKTTVPRPSAGNGSAGGAWAEDAKVASTTSAPKLSSARPEDGLGSAANGPQVALQIPTDDDSPGRRSPSCPPLLSANAAEGPVAVKAVQMAPASSALPSSSSWPQIAPSEDDVFEENLVSAPTSPGPGVASAGPVPPSMPKPANTAARTRGR